MAQSKFIPRHRVRDGCARPACKGFAVGTLLFILMMIGVVSGIIFSGYTQSLKSGIGISNSIKARNDLEIAASTLSVTSVFSYDGRRLCPPNMDGAEDIGENAILDPQKCPKEMPILLDPLSSADASRLPAPLIGEDLADFVSDTLSPPVNVGILKDTSGMKRRDPWGRYYIVCRWDRVLSDDDVLSSPAVQVMSAGPDGVMKTRCGNDTAAENLAQSVTIAGVLSKLTVWSVTSKDDVSTATFGSVGVSVSAKGDLMVPRNITLSGHGKFTVSRVDVLVEQGNIRLETGNLTLDDPDSAIVADRGLFNKSLAVGAGFSVSSETQKMVLGSSVLVVDVSTGASVVSGGMSVASAAEFGDLEIHGVLTAGTPGMSTPAIKTKGPVSIGHTAGTSGTSFPYLSVGELSGGKYPFSIDQKGTLQSDNISAVSIAASDSLTVKGSVTVKNTLSVGGTYGTITATDLKVDNIVGIQKLTVENLEVEEGSEGITGQGFINLDITTGILPIDKGGTGMSALSLSQVYESLGGGDASFFTIGPLPVERMSLLSPSPLGGPYAEVFVDDYGRVTTGNSFDTGGLSNTSGDSIVLQANTITVTINNSVKGLWNATGLSIGTGSVARGVLDLGYNVDAAIMPVGATADRAATPAIGMVRYNTTANVFEGFIGTPPSWKAFTSGGPLNGSFDGICGTDHGRTLSYTPVNLCYSGVVGQLVGTGNPNWNWTCTGIGSGTTVSCSATALNANGACGADDGALVFSTPRNLCLSGTPVLLTNGYTQWTWGCYGAAGGASVGCKAFAQGVCNPESNNAAIEHAPDQLSGCSSGQFGNLVFSGTVWTWTCYSGTGGINAVCMATKTMNGACGTANGQIVSIEPVGAVACSIGARGAISGIPGSTIITWSCGGIGLGYETFCQANAPVEAFSFASKTAVPLSTVALSDEITLGPAGGFEDLVATCDYGCADIIVNGVRKGTGPVFGINAGDRIAIEHLSSSLYGTTTTASITIGTTTGTFSVTTVATADAYTIPSQTGVDPGSTVIATVSPTWAAAGPLTATILSCTEQDANCKLSCDLGSSWTDNCQISSGNPVWIRQTASALYGGEVIANLVIGYTAGNFSATTVQTAGSFNFTPQTGIALTAVATSAAITPSWTGGGTLPVSIPSCTGTSCQISCNGAAFAETCTLTSGQSLSVRQTVSSSHGVQTTATVRVGSTQGSFMASTVRTAEPFSFPSKTGLALDAIVTSDSATPTWADGGTLTAAVSSCTGSNCLVSCNGGLFVESCTLSSGQALAVRQTTPSLYGALIVATVNVGTTTATFSATTVNTATEFVFSPQTGVPLSSVVTSNSVAPIWTGGGTLPVSIPSCTGANCQVSCNGGTYASSCVLSSGQSLSARMTVPDTYGTTVQMEVSAGGTTAMFSATTVKTAEAFSFISQTGLVPGSVATSAAVTLTWTGGGTLPVSIPSCTGTSCQVSCNGGTFATTCTITSGQSIVVRQTISGSNFTTTEATVLVGSTTAGFSARTIATASPFTLASQTGVARNTVITSANATPSWAGGETLAVSIPACTGTNCQVSCNGGAFASTCNLSSGQTLAVRQTSSTDYGATTTATAQVGTTTATFTITTVNTAGAFTFTSQSGLGLAAVATSNNATPTWTGGGTLPASIPSCTGTNCQVSCNGTAFVATCNLTTGQTLAVRQTTSSSFGTTTTAEVLVGATSATFNATTMATADPFTFTAKTGLPLSTVSTSDPVTLSWVGGNALTATVSMCTGTNCQVSCNNGATWGAECTLNSGQAIMVRQTTSSSYGVETQLNVTVGITTATFSATTVNTAGAFSFTTQTGLTPSTVATSNAISPSWTGGGTLPVSIPSCSGASCQISCNGAAYATTCNLTSGQTLAVRQTSSASHYTTTVATVQIGSTTGTFTVRTIATAGAFTFATQTGVAPSTVITSANATPTWTGGETLPVSIPACTGTSCQVSCNGAAYATTCNLTSGQTLAVRQTSSASHYTETVATVQVGSTTGTFTVRTIATAGAFTFATQTGVAPSTVITSANATPTWSGGETLAVSIPTCTGASCQVSCNGAAYATTCNLTTGQTLAVRQTSSASHYTTTVATVQVGSTTGTFTVRTIATAGAFTFATQTGVAPSTVITSANATPTWTGGETLPVSIPACTGANCQVSCNGAAYATTCNLTTGQTLAVRQTSSASGFTETVATVRVGHTNATFTVKTVATVSALTFVTQTGVAPSTAITSANATPTWTGGETLAVSIPTCTGTVCQVSCNGAAYATICNLTTGQTLAVRQISSASHYTTTVATVQVGYTTATFSVRTIATAGAFTFASQTGVAVSTVTTSANATPTWTGGETLPVSIPACTGTSCQVSCNGAAYATTCNLTTGQTLAVRQTSSASGFTETVATVRVGSTNATFSVTTGSADPCAGTPEIGAVCADGTVFAGPTPDGSIPMFAMPCDMGMTASCSGGSCTCTGSRSTYTWGMYETTTGFNSRTTGMANTYGLVNAYGANVPAANACRQQSYGGYNDWYLPAIDELNYLCNGTTSSGACTRAALIKNFDTSGITYWASTEFDNYDSLALRFNNGTENMFGYKLQGYYVRCVRTGAFSFASQTGVALSTVITSANATPIWTGGGTRAVSIASCTGSNCQVSCNGGAFGASCTLSSGQTLAVRQTSSASNYTETVAMVQVGPTTGRFSVRTIATAGAFSFVSQTGVALSTVAESIEASPTWVGDDILPVSIPSCTGTSCQVSCNGGTYATTCNLTTGQTLAVRQTSSASHYTETVATVRVGSTDGTFTVRTIATAGAFTFASQTGVEVSTVITSANATPTWTGGETLAVSIPTCTGTSCQVSCNGGAYATTCNLTSGQTLAVRQTSSASYGTATVATVRVGSTNGTFSVTTGEPCGGIGGVCGDGTVYAGPTPDGGGPMYAMPCDLGMTASCSGGTCTCSGTRANYTWGQLYVKTGYTSMTTGKANTYGLVAKYGTGVPAAKACRDQTYGGHNDWYLPATYEMSYMCNGTTSTGSCTRAALIKNFTTSIVYWSSTETSLTNAMYLMFSNGYQNSHYKNNGCPVRCVRR